MKPKPSNLIGHDLYAPLNSKSPKAAKPKICDSCKEEVKQLFQGYSFRVGELVITYECEGCYGDECINDGLAA